MDRKWLAKWLFEAPNPTLGRTKSLIGSPAGPNKATVDRKWWLLCPRGTPKTGHAWTPENRPTRWLNQDIEPAGRLRSVT